MYCIKLKIIADKKSNIVELMSSVFDQVEKILRKGENPGYKHFLHFHSIFKSYLLQGFKALIAW